MIELKSLFENISYSIIDVCDELSGGESQIQKEGEFPTFLNLLLPSFDVKANRLFQDHELFSEFASAFQGQHPPIQAGDNSRKRENKRH